MSVELLFVEAVPRGILGLTVPSGAEFHPFGASARCERTLVQGRVAAR